MKKRIDQIKKYIKEEKNLFAQNETDIKKINHQDLTGLLLGFIVMCIVICVIVATNKEYINTLSSYLVAVVGFTVFFAINYYAPKKWVLFNFYLFFIILLIYSAYSTAIVYPDYTGVISLGVFILMPVLILDKTPRNSIVEIILLVIYLIYVAPRKNWVIQQDEIIYNVSFTILGLILGIYLRRVRLQNLDLLRESEIRETTDVLTGLYNRRKLFNYFSECEEKGEEHLITGLSILDIDFFKSFNDTYGHLEGDKCLKAVGNCLNEYGKQHNMEFYRYGGEEFVAIAHEKNREKLAADFNNIVSSIENLHIPRANGFVTISQGVFFLDNQSQQRIEQTIPIDNAELEGSHLAGLHFQHYLSKADDALYQAKNKGRNRTVYDN